MRTNRILSIILCFAVILTELSFLIQNALAADPNLKITGVVRSYSTPSVGNSVRFDVYTRNDGQAAAPNSQARLRIDSGNNGSFENSFYQGVGALNPGDSRSISFNWTATAAGTYAAESCADTGNVITELNESDNCYTQVFNVTGAGTVVMPPVNPPPIVYPPAPQYAELSIEGVTRSLTASTVGDQVSFRIFIKNSGPITAVGSTARLRIDRDNNGSFETILYQNTSAIPAGETQSSIFNWTAAAAGTYAAESCADATNIVTELNENNNCSSQTFNVVTSGGSYNPPPGQTYPNLKITGVVRSYSTPSVGNSVRFDVYTRNDGQAAAPNSQARLRIDSGNNGSFENSFYQGVGALNPGDSRSISFNWTATAAGTYAAESCADTGNVITELNESDNCYTQVFNVTGAGTVVMPPVNPPPIVYPPAPQPPPIYLPSPQPPQIIYQPSPAQQIIYQQPSSPQIIYQQSSSPQVIYYPPNYYNPILADLSVADISLSPAKPDVNNTVTIRASIRNNSGTMRAEASEASLRIDDQNSGTSDPNLRHNVDYLSPGDYRAVTFYWTPAVTGNHRLELCADSGGHITESDETNNCTIQYVNVNSDGSSYLPQISFYSVPFNINRGGSSTLVWSTAKATSCYASEGWSGNKAASGTETIYPANTRDYWLTCYNSYGQNQVKTTVYVDGAAAASQNLVASCVANPAATTVGRQVIFAAGEAGARGTPAYNWSGDVYGTGITKKMSFSSPGQKTAVMTVTDGSGRSATAQCSVQVNKNGYAAPAKIYKPQPPAVQPQTQDACAQYPAGTNINNYYYGSCSAPDNIGGYETNLAPSQEQKPLTATLSLGLGGAGKFFFWLSIVMLNLFLLAALVYVFVYISRTVRASNP